MKAFVRSITRTRLITINRKSKRVNFPIFCCSPMSRLVTGPPLLTLLNPQTGPAGSPSFGATASALYVSVSVAICALKNALIPRSLEPKMKFDGQFINVFSKR